MFLRVPRALAAAALTLAVGSPLVSQAMTPGVFRGRVVHVSVDNIKVKSPSGEVLSFLILPRFHKIFHADGKTTATMNEVRTGDRVEIYYDQKAMGARHADQIIDMTAPLRPLKT
jgi:hypothetical protein